jgi:hypothetical protein
MVIPNVVGIVVVGSFERWNNKSSCRAKEDR